MQHDETFLTLLSSQRELLTRLNMENNQRRIAATAPAAAGYGRPQRQYYYPSAALHQQFACPPTAVAAGAILPPHLRHHPNAGPVAPHYGMMSGYHDSMMRVPTNRGIDDRAVPEQRTEADILGSSRRMSLGMASLRPYPINYQQHDAIEEYGAGGAAEGKASPGAFARRRTKFEDMSFPSGPSEQQRRLSLLPGLALDCSEAGAGGFLKRDKLDDADCCHTLKPKKKRRLSSLGFLSSSFFEDNLKDASEHGSVALMMRRGSLGSCNLDVDAGIQPLPFASKHEEDKEEKEEDDDENVIQVIVDGDADSDDEDYEAEATGTAAKPASSTTAGRTCQKAAVVDPFKLKEALEKFTKSMEMSQKSQQAIHDWDRKMGLKRSHSKTMRQSTRSRKKLRTNFKKEIASIISSVTNSKKKN